MNPSSLVLTPSIIEKIQPIIDELNNIAEVTLISHEDIINKDIVKYRNLKIYTKYAIVIYVPVEDDGNPVFMDRMSLMIEMDWETMNRIFTHRPIGYTGETDIYLELRTDWSCMEPYSTADEQMFASILKDKHAFRNGNVAPMPEGHFIAQLFGSK